MNGRPAPSPLGPDSSRVTAVHPARGAARCQGSRRGAEYGSRGGARRCAEAAWMPDAGTDEALTEAAVVEAKGGEMPAMPRVGVVPYDRTRAILDGTVGADAGFAFEAASVMDITMALLDGGSLDGRFDAGEMSLATFAKAVDEGLPLRAIPVFTNRKFFQQYIYVRPNAGIRSLADLRGRRVGAIMYWMTSSVWHRQLLESEAGVAAGDVSWTTLMPERMESMAAPAGVEIQCLGRSSPQGLLNLVLDGTVDCVLGAVTSPDILAVRDQVARPFADIGAEQRDYFARTQIFPIVHVLVCRAELLQRDPGAADRLAKAFAEAKQAAYDWMQDEARTALPLVRGYLEETAEIFGPDPFQDGLEPNRLVLETFLTAAAAQGLTTRRLAPEDLFA